MHGNVNTVYGMQMGYRHFDTAKLYGSEPAVGNALTQAFLDGTVDREEVFVTSKLWGADHHDPVSALQQTLKYACAYHIPSLFSLLIAICKLLA